MNWPKVLTTLAALFFLISSIICPTESVECYKCDSKSDGQKCLDPFDPPGIRIRTCANCIVIIILSIIMKTQLIKLIS
jgi:hypothetical protein